MILFCSVFVIVLDFVCDRALRQFGYFGFLTFHDECPIQRLGWRTCETRSDYVDDSVAFMETPQTRKG